MEEIETVKERHKGREKDGDSVRITASRGARARLVRWGKAARRARVEAGQNKRTCSTVYGVSHDGQRDGDKPDSKRE